MSAIRRGETYLINLTAKGISRQEEHLKVFLMTLIQNIRF